MTEKTKVDIELPIKCSTVKNTSKYFDRFFTAIIDISWTILEPIVNLFVWIFSGIGTYGNKYQVQIICIFFMGMSLYVMLDIPINSTPIETIVYYSLGGLGFSIGFICSVLSAIEHYNVDINIRCKKE